MFLCNRFKLSFEKWNYRMKNAIIVSIEMNKIYKFTKSTKFTKFTKSTKSTKSTKFNSWITPILIWLNRVFKLIIYSQILIVLPLVIPMFAWSLSSSIWFISSDKYRNCIYPMNLVEEEEHHPNLNLILDLVYMLFHINHLTQQYFNLSRFIVLPQFKTEYYIQNVIMFIHISILNNNTSIFGGSLFL